MDLRNVSQTPQPGREIDQRRSPFRTLDIPKRDQFAQVMGLPEAAQPTRRPETRRLSPLAARPRPELDSIARRRWCEFDKGKIERICDERGQGPRRLHTW